MQRQHRQNPYKNTRIPIIITKPMLTHGEQNYSLYKYMSKKKRLYTSQQPLTDKQVEERILWQHQKQYYGYDENGCSLAEWDFERRIHEKTQIQDQRPFFGIKTQRNEIIPSETTSARSLEGQFLGQNPFKLYTNGQKRPHIKSPRQRNRQQIHKIRNKLKQFKEYQFARYENKKNFSVLNLYKAKKVEYFSGVFTFGELQLNPKIQLVQQKIQIKLEAGSMKNHKKMYPKSIFIGNEQYFNIPFL